MNATVTKANGKIVKVKNLGWLLKHWKKVESFTLAKKAYSGEMVGHLKDNVTYRCQWASYNLMIEWLNRPVFRGVKIEYK